MGKEMAIKLPCAQKKSDVVASFLREFPMGMHWKGLYQLPMAA